MVRVAPHFGDSFFHYVSVSCIGNHGTSENGAQKNLDAGQASVRRSNGQKSQTMEDERCQKDVSPGLPKYMRPRRPSGICILENCLILSYLKYHSSGDSKLAFQVGGQQHLTTNGLESSSFVRELLVFTKSNSRRKAPSIHRPKGLQRQNPGNIISACA